MHAIGEIEDIDGGNEAKLVGLGVRSTDDFLTRAATPGGRAGLAAAVGVTEAVVLKWANCADLMRVDGIGMQFADLLEEAGVDTIPELAQRNAHNLHERVVQVNTERALAGRAPTENEVESWIAQAKALPRILEYGGAASAGSTTPSATQPAPATAPAAPTADTAAAPSSPAPAPVPAASGFEPAPPTVSPAAEPTAAPVSSAPEPATAPASSASDAGSGASDDAEEAPAPFAASTSSSASSSTAQPTSWFTRLLNRLRGGG